MSLVAIALLLLTVPFVLPIALWVALYRTRTRLAMLEEALKEQGDLLNRVSGQLASASARSAAARPRRSRCASGQPNARAATAETKPAAARPLGETSRLRVGELAVKKCKRLSRHDGAGA